MDEEVLEDDIQKLVDDDLENPAEVEPGEEVENQEQEVDTIFEDTPNEEVADNLSQANEDPQEDANPIDDETALNVKAVDIEADEQDLNVVDEPDAEISENPPDDVEQISERDEPIEEEDVVPVESETDPTLDDLPADSIDPIEEPRVEADRGNASDPASTAHVNSPEAVPEPMQMTGEDPASGSAMEPTTESQSASIPARPDISEPDASSGSAINPQTVQATAAASSAASNAAAAESAKPVPESVLTLRRMLREAISEYTQLTMDGLKTQSRIATLKYNSSGQATNLHYTVNADTGELNRQYVQNLSRLTDLYNVFKAKQDTFNSKISRLNKLLDEEDENAAELKESFKQFRRELCKAAVFNRTGASFSMKKMEKLETIELEKDRELESLRLKHIHYRNQLKKQEEAVKQKEQLSEGLHLIDFEQLKIENQTLNEKIEERNDDLHKLKKKVTTTVQVLTHIKEKVEFIEQENEALKKELTTLDRELQEKRDHMAKAKRIRDRLRAQCQGDLKQ